MPSDGEIPKLLAVLCHDQGSRADPKHGDGLFHDQRSEAQHGNGIVTLRQGETLSVNDHLETENNHFSPSKQIHYLVFKPETPQFSLYDTGNLIRTVWHRANEVDTWSFCRQELLSIFETFARTGTAPFLFASSLRTVGLHSFLQRTVGVCATYVLAGKEKSLPNSLLTAHIDQMTVSHSGVDDLWSTYIFRSELARLQSVVFYQIIRWFSDSPASRLAAEQAMPMISEWIDSLEARIHVLSSENLGEQFLATTSDVVEADHVEFSEIQAAFRTILALHFARAVYTVMRYGICPFIEEPGLNTLAVYVQPIRTLTPRLSVGVKSTVTYQDLVDNWNGSTPVVNGTEGRFIELLLIACKVVKAQRRWRTYIQLLCK